MTRARLLPVLILASLSAACRSEPIALGLHFERGSAQNVALAMTQVVTEEREGNVLESAQEVRLHWHQEILELRPDGSAVIALTYDRASLAADNPTFGSIRYDSEAPTEEVPLLAIGLQAAIGETVQLVVDPRGEILEVPGIEDFADRIALKLELPPSADLATVRANLRQWFSEDALREMMRPVFSIYPAGLVRTGDSWKRAVTIARPFPHRRTNRYELIDLDDDTATVRVRSKIEPSDDATVEYDYGTTARFAVEGSIEGRLLIDRRTGLVVIGELEQELEGKVTTTLASGESFESKLELEGLIKYAVDG